jgi:hypothetical protein
VRGSFASSFNSALLLAAHTAAAFAAFTASLRGFAPGHILIAQGRLLRSHLRSFWHFRLPPLHTLLRDLFFSLSEIKQLFESGVDFLPALEVHLFRGASNIPEL